MSVDFLSLAEIAALVKMLTELLNSIDQINLVLERHLAQRHLQKPKPDLDIRIS